MNNKTKLMKFDKLDNNKKPHKRLDISIWQKGNFECASLMCFTKEFENIKKILVNNRSHKFFVVFDLPAFLWGFPLQFASLHRKKMRVNERRRHVKLEETFSKNEQRRAAWRKWE